MSDTLDDDKPTRRDFLYITTGAFGVVGAASVAWPLIDQLNPDASVKAVSKDGSRDANMLIVFTL